MDYITATEILRCGRGYRSSLDETMKISKGGTIGFESKKRPNGEFYETTKLDGYELYLCGAVYKEKEPYLIIVCRNKRESVYKLFRTSDGSDKLFKRYIGSENDQNRDSLVEFDSNEPEVILTKVLDYIISSEELKSEYN